MNIVPSFSSPDSSHTGMYYAALSQYTFGNRSIWSCLGSWLADWFILTMMNLPALWRSHRLCLVNCACQWGVYRIEMLLFTDGDISGLMLTISVLSCQLLLDTIQYNTIQYNTIQYNTIQYNTIQYNTIQYNTIQYNTITYNCPKWEIHAADINIRWHYYFFPHPSNHFSLPDIALSSLMEVDREVLQYWFVCVLLDRHLQPDFATE